MKKFLTGLLAVCLLVGLWIFGIPEVHAAGHTDHCVCGGSAKGIHDHACETIEWKPLSSVVTLTAVNWKDVPAGNYYLDGNVTVTANTDGNAIGQIQLVSGTKDVYEVVQTREVSLCLNGYKITTTEARVFRGVYADSTLNICDCSGKQVDGVWQWDGEIWGGTTKYGGITYTFADSTVNIYGGNLTTRNTQIHGGLFYVAQDYASIGDADGKTEAAYASTMNIYNGNLYGGKVSSTGGNICVSHYSNLNIYGGYLHDGTAGAKGGNIYFKSNGTLTLQNATIYNGTASESGNVYPTKDSHYSSNNIYGGYPECVHVVTGENISHEYSLAAALTKVTEGSYLKLMQDLNAQTKKTGETEYTDTEISGTVHLDMNGCDLSGVTISGTVYGFDSATDCYSGDNAGKLTGTVSGQVLAKEQYLLLGEEGYSFHRYDVEITHLSLKPANAAMGYKAKFQGDDAIAGNVSAFGYEMWLDGYNPCTYSAKEFTSGKVLTLRLQNILSQDNTLEENLKNAETKIYATAFIQLSDGTKVSCDQVAHDFKEMLNMADDNYADYTTAQKDALQALATKFSKTMMTWDVENFHHADGGMWTALDSKTFLNILTKTTHDYGGTNSATVYCLPSGSYVLTEDVDVDDMRLGVLPGATVNICLNSHTITSSVRTLFIFGDLNLCDCHTHGEAEGGITSSATIFCPVFYIYHDGCFNLYGGNLRSTLNYNHSAIGAVSHDGDSSDPTQKPGVMNMYGGTVANGKVTGNGGLISIWNNATFNMYGGELYGGHAEGNGGAIQMSSGQIYIYGGSIHDNTADDNGGAINLGSGQLHFYGGSITGNSSGIYTAGGKVTLRNSPQIKDNTTYNLYLAGSSADFNGLSTDAQVHFTTKIRGYLSDNTTLIDSLVAENCGGLVIRAYNGKLMLLPETTKEFSTVNTFSVGYATFCSNPEDPVGLPLAGYGNTSNRLSTQVIDDLYVSVVAMTDENNNTVLLYTCDIQRFPESLASSMRSHISRATGVPYENIYLSCTHTHSAPDMTNGMAVIKEYGQFLTDGMVQIALEAMADRQAATTQYGSMDIERMNFVRHYYYYDENGEKQNCGDNFGVYPSDKSADNLFHATEGDHSLQVIRFVREGKDVVLANWAAHPHFTGGAAKTDISSDYVGPFRDAVQESEDCYFAFIQGAGGNMNETSNITGENQFSNSINKNNTARTLYGQKMAAYVSQILKNMTDVEKSGLIQVGTNRCDVPINHSEDNKVEKAQELRSIYYTWKDETFPTENGRSPTSAEIRAFCQSYGFQSIYHANAVISKSKDGATGPVEVNVFSIGNVLAFYTAPGELWSDTALEMREYSPFSMTFTVGYTNQDWNYFPDGDAAGGYENYESQLSHLKHPDAVNAMKAFWKEALDKFFENAQ